MNENINNLKKLSVGILVGSLRSGSYSKAIANSLFELAPDNIKLMFIEIGDLPFYNNDLDTGAIPKSWARLRSQVKSCDGFIFITPEYNRSIPAVLKNALDVASDPYGENKWAGKTGGIICHTVGALGGLAAGIALRQPMSCLDIHLLQQPEMYLSQIDTQIDENGKLKDQSIKDFIKAFLDAFAAFTEKLSS